MKSFSNSGAIISEKEIHSALSRSIKKLASRHGLQMANVTESDSLELESLQSEEESSDLNERLMNNNHQVEIGNRNVWT